ncbi:MAG TPA: AAA domain-containing protein [Clostridiaceae bacterium]|nr:AAA domain-containing protein [Clostridiaceae bacterium]
MEDIMHLVLKYNDSVYSVDTIEEHRKVIRDKGKVVWGIIKPKNDSPGISGMKIKQIKTQIENNIPTYAFMCTGGEIEAKGYIIDIINAEEVYKMKDLVPDYYKRDLNKCVAGVLLSKIEDENSNIISKLKRYGTIDGNVALGNQTNPLYVSVKEDFASNEHITVTHKKEEKEHEEVVMKVENIPELINYIHRYILLSGYKYTFEDLANFYLCLKTKPFVILAGISGTGKSKLIRLFANSLGSNVENGRLNIIPVKPDWNDNSELFGYKNINNEFIPGKLTEVILKASNDLDRMYFVCLDEMNLARVEYYLSDYLSIIESREFKNHRIVTDKIFDREYFKFDTEYIGDYNRYENLCIPENLYLIGTVNMDDTTYAFSRKVLDRANTIEFSEVDLEDLTFNNEKLDERIVSNDFLKTSFLTIKDAIDFDREYVEKVNNKIVQINNVLKRGNRHFGYRVRDEILFYMLENKKLGLLQEDMAFDYQIMQKVLPTITGSDTKIKDILIELYNICNPEKPIDITSRTYIDDAEKFLSSAKYKKSAKKITEMLRGYSDGFTSYWI